MTARLLQGMQPRAWLTRENITLGLFLVLLAVWNIPHTIALRYGLGGILLIMILASRTFQLRAFRETSWPLLLFFVYLLVYALLLSDDTATTFKNLKGEWLKFCLFAIVGWGVGRTLLKRPAERTLLSISIACGLPLLIHIGMVAGKFFQTGEVPFSYWGLHEHHADLGWAALFSMSILSILIFAGSSKATPFIFCIMFLVSIASLLIAHSRAALVFTFVVFFLVLVLNLSIAAPSGKKWGKTLVLMGFVLAQILAAILFVQTRDENRWSNMQNRIDLGFEADPLDVICKGLPFLKERLAAQGLSLSAEQETELQYVNDGDGLRALLFRAGLILTAKHPLGINASKFAYQEAINLECKPAIHGAHIHIGWLDTAISIGIPGALLYLFVLLSYTIQGLRGAKSENGKNLFALSLAITAFTWIIRGMIDSTQRDQMLEMQICLITCFAASMYPANNSSTNGLQDAEKAT